MKHQVPIPPNVWLYKEESKDSRLWAKAVDLPDSTPYWDECTQEKRDEWEREHESEPTEEAAELNE